MLLVMRLMEYPFEVAALYDKSYKQLMHDPANFWAKHSRKNVSEEFKQLTSMLLQHQPAGRATMADIVAHEWMRGEVATDQEFATHVQAFMDAAQAARQ